ncbi:MAG: energy coupling factor transporter S component ThiW [Eubacteriales bacterium]|nr:energy coupling factor transporter S component ThiW [Eubacteriales bacterium]
MNNGLNVRKMALTGMLACLSFVLCTFVYFPQMAPFQHFVDVIAAVLLGPWYACAAAFICGIMRMLSGRTIQAVVGAIFGPICGGLLYKKTHSFLAVAVGEVFGTGIIGAICVYPLMKMFYSEKAAAAIHWYYYIPFYIPSAVMGAVMGIMVLLILKRTGMLSRMKRELGD